MMVLEADLNATNDVTLATIAQQLDQVLSGLAAIHDELLAQRERFARVKLACAALLAEADDRPAGKLERSETSLDPETSIGPP